MPFKFSIPPFPLLQLYTPLILRNLFTMKSNGDDSVVDTIFPNFATFHKDRAIRIERSTNITERCTIRRALSPINRVSRVLSREKCGSVAFANEPY